MKIETISIIGMGALGILLADQLSQKLPKENIRIVADKKRQERYKEKGIFVNGIQKDFHFVLPEEKTTPADLLVFAVKYPHLEQAMKDAQNQVGDNTVILSLINGIVSEEELGQKFGFEKIIYTVAQGMDAVSKENHLTYKTAGCLCVGEKNGEQSERLEAVASIFEKCSINYQIRKDMPRHLWNKFMFNVGVNQVVAVYGGHYKGVQLPGEKREMMINAMKEAQILSEKEGIFLTDQDTTYWLNILNTLDANSDPSMAQDVQARRKTEVELFSETVLKLAEKHGIEVPVNQELYNKILAIEKKNK